MYEPQTTGCLRFYSAMGKQLLGRGDLQRYYIFCNAVLVMSV
jgi:hypothetical protein